MKRVIISLSILILGLTYAVQDNDGSKKAKMNPSETNRHRIEKISNISKVKYNPDFSIPRSMNFQGTLFQDGSPVNDTMDMWFGIYSAPAVGYLLYQQTKLDVGVINGWFSVILTNMPDTVFNKEGPIRFLEIKVPATGFPMEPRLPLMSVGYSFHSNSSDTAEYARGAQILRPIDPPISGTEIAKPCSLEASVDDPGSLLVLSNPTGVVLDITESGEDAIIVRQAGDCGLYVDYADTSGVKIHRARKYGVEVDSAGWYGLLVRAAPYGIILDSVIWGLYIDTARTFGIVVGSSGQDGVVVSRAARNGFEVSNCGENGLEIDNVGDNGVYIGDAGYDGVRVELAEQKGFSVGGANIGFHVDSASANGVRIGYAGMNAIVVHSATEAGVYVESAEKGFVVGNAQVGVAINHTIADGVHINGCGGDGVEIDSVENDGVHVNLGFDDGVHIGHVGSDGFYVDYCWDNGVLIDWAGNDGIHIRTCDGDGLEVDSADEYGVKINYAGTDGVYAIGQITGGNFYAGHDAAVGLEAHSYNNSSVNTAIQAYGRGYATGGWFTGGLKENKEAPCLISPELGIIAAGTAKLNNGKAEISYPEVFKDNIRSDIPISITVTPNEDPSGLLYVSKNITNGFQVNLKKIPGWGDNTDLSFNWIAYATLKEPETSAEAKAEWEKMMREREERRTRNEEMQKEREMKQKEIKQREIENQ